MRSNDRAVEAARQYLQTLFAPDGRSQLAPRPQRRRDAPGVPGYREGGGVNADSRPALTAARLAQIRRVAEGHIANAHRIRDHEARNATLAMAYATLEVLAGYDART